MAKTLSASRLCIFSHLLGKGRKDLSLFFMVCNWKYAYEMVTRKYEKSLCSSRAISKLQIDSLLLQQVCLLCLRVCPFHRSCFKYDCIRDEWALVFTFHPEVLVSGQEIYTYVCPLFWNQGNLAFSPFSSSLWNTVRGDLQLLSTAGSYWLFQVNFLSCPLS